MNTSSKPDIAFGTGFKLNVKSLGKLSHPITPEFVRALKEIQQELAHNGVNDIFSLKFCRYNLRGCSRAYYFRERFSENGFVATIKVPRKILGLIPWPKTLVRIKSYVADNFYSSPKEFIRDLYARLEQAYNCSMEQKLAQVESNRLIQQFSKVAERKR